MNPLRSSRRFLWAPVVFAASLSADAASIWINEFHYDNVGIDTGEFIELAGTAGADLSGYSLLLYNGNGGAAYTTTPLSGLIPNQANGFGTVSIAYPTNGLQNDVDGIALAFGGSLLEFLSYEGIFQGVGGPANGTSSLNIGISETASTPVGASLGLAGHGSDRGDFVWTQFLAGTPGQVNAGQTFDVPDAAPTALLLLGSLSTLFAFFRRGRELSLR